MNFRVNINFGIILSAGFAASGCVKSDKGNEADTNSPQKINVVYILADDLGIGDVGCFGQKLIPTPNIDKLAKSGMMLTNHYSGCAVCAPARASLMTGMHTGHSQVRGNKGYENEGQFPISDSIFTVAELFKQAGYITGMFGKWGLGAPQTEGDPNNQGFDEFYGYNCQSYAHRYYPPHLWHNQTKVPFNNEGKNPTLYAPDSIQHYALKFLDKNKENPFFLFLPYTLPHAELVVPDDSILAKFKGMFPETPHTTGNDYGTPEYNDHRYCNQAIPHATFAAMVYRLDMYVGQVMQKLEELGLANNTLVIFTSDNGPHHEGGADPEFFNSNGPYRGVKRDFYDGGLRMPTIAVWPNKIKPNTSSDVLSAFYDFMPTVADLIGAKTDGLNFDGKSMMGNLLGKNEEIHTHLYWELYDSYNGAKFKRRGLRTNQYKAIYTYYIKSDTAITELFDLIADTGEVNNLYHTKKALYDSLFAVMQTEHRPYNDYIFAK